MKIYTINGITETCKECRINTVLDIFNKDKNIFEENDLCFECLIWEGLI